MEINCLLYMRFSSAYSISLDADEVASHAGCPDIRAMDMHADQGQVIT